MYLWVTPEELDDQADSPYALEACRMASFILWAFSGRKYGGTQTVTETYECACRRLDRRDLIPTSSFAAMPVLVNGNVQNFLTGACDCNPLSHTRLRLRGRPVTVIHRVVVGGETLSPDNYRVINYGTLQAAPGGSFDPCGATITYTYGAEPPTAGRRAARNLASELTKGWSGDEECRLPDRITSISRQGVSYTVLDQQDFLDDLRTGIYSVDLFLRAVNPDRARKPARILSPDMPKVIRATPVPTDPQATDLVVTPGVAFTWTVSLRDLDAQYVYDENWDVQAQLVSCNNVVLNEFPNSKFTVTSTSITLHLTNMESAAITEGGTFELYAAGESSTIISLLTSTLFLT